MSVFIYLFFNTNIARADFNQTYIKKKMKFLPFYYDLRNKNIGNKCLLLL